MKFFLKRIYYMNASYYKIWSYLWIMSNSKNEIVFKYASLGGKLGVSKSTISRSLKLMEVANKDKLHIELSLLNNNEYLLKFYPSGKVKKKEQEIMINEIYIFLQSFYKKHEIHYPELTKHKTYIKKICNKLIVLMKQRKIDINDSNIQTSFQSFFNNIPEWWLNNQFTLYSIHKNFTKVYNQIKSKSKPKLKEHLDEINKINFN
tara:strand:+ start:5033 stop:5647 length:615 start_codon:yes stop_codon:yes gene_type:complete